MLPLHQANEIRHSILEYLKATFSFKDRAVHEAFYKFINDKEDGIFKGPYLSLKLPFVTSEDIKDIPLEISPDFPPYDHQLKSFKRLTTEGQEPKSTIITTGTSSGKTESFLFPFLDYCFKNQHRRGIKVIILYPMNALATDQAKRIAEIIWRDERLKGKITAGLFIGEGKQPQKYHTDMGDDHIIENKQTIIDSPPDILLTNFKMLDYALMRADYNNLWIFNFEDKDLLKFLALDELHVYDGAQGTDVANLIRRLKLKLSIEKGQLCGVGTSATIGEGEESKKLLIEYAEKIYGESFDADALITEKRVETDDFFRNEDKESNKEDNVLENFFPRIAGLIKSKLGPHETYRSYISKQKELWQMPDSADEIKLGLELKKLQFVRDIAHICSNGIIDINTLLNELSLMNSEFEKFPEWDPVNDFSPREELLGSILSLISEAKSGSGKKFPFLYIQIQIWIRELSPVLREIGTKPKFVWKDSVSIGDEAVALPPYFCRECGASGWLGVKEDNNHKSFNLDLNHVYECFFNNHKNIYFVNTTDHRHVQEYQPDTVLEEYLDKFDLSLHEEASEDCVKIHAVRKLKETKSRHICPECNTENTLSIIGTKVATLSSITVSQALASDLDERTEKYRKVLAFTNSVQDAAHQAGFVEARNYRFTFRSSLQKVINELNRPINLKDLQDEFIKYWKSNADETGNNDAEAYYFRFIPSDYKGKLDLTNDFRQHGNFVPSFKEEFDLRVGWEVISEFGYNALIGRTLEKSGASAVKFDDTKLKTLFSKLENWLQENNLVSISEAELIPFINGILHRIRIRGAIDHKYFSKYRSGNQELGELNWWHDNRHFLNRNFGQRIRLPKLLTSEPHAKGMLDSSYTSGNSWFRSYFKKSFPMAQDYFAIVNDFYAKLFEVLTEEGILNKKNSSNKGNSNYAILPEVIIAENKVKVHECNKCSSVLYVAASDELSENTPCLDYNCADGKYIPKEIIRPNYYQFVYNRKRSPRIYAAEHTGLLERKDREKKERDFKERPKFNSLNTIVATSTLEMGIDIGSLNLALNNSVPPMTSNFLQRVGRAGRSSGTALVINFAQNKPHDLFYFNEPTDMMQGEIATPACFLEAKDILFRHFFAFCLDSWAKLDPINNRIPGVVMALKLLHADLSSRDFIFNKIISYIKANEDLLLNRFSEIYRPDLRDPAVLEALKELLKNDSLYERIIRVFKNLKKEYEFIQEKRREIDDYIIKNKLSKTDDARKLLEKEKSAFWGLKRLIDARHIIEHLTNIGLLPNYAFPETGVTLNAWVKNVQAKGSQAIPNDIQFELVRAASVAIRELAPGNHFYSQGYKFEISGLNTYDWREPGILMEKRFCSNCDHIEHAPKSNEQSCPKCGDNSWSSIKNKHVFVKISGVKSIVSRDKATLDDSSEERDSNQYRISNHLKFDNSSFQGAWGMKEIPFGIEYVKNVEIQTINLGLKSSNDSNQISINKLEKVPCHGFVTCKHCGKSTAEPHRIKKNDNFSHFHYGFCKHKEVEYKGEKDNIFEEVFLFRENKTEAIKVLLPVQDLDGEAQVSMFKAGLELGLKKYYRGNIQHLSLLDYQEYNKNNFRFDRYLVICDNISGGTGYLDKLFDPTVFSEVLIHAYQAIKECGCQYKGKDGCYRCIYTYNNQRIHDLLSRSNAEQLFKKITERSAAWEKYQTGLGAMTSKGQIEESELEDRFVRSLGNYIQRKEREGWLFEKDYYEGIVNYKFKIKKENRTYSYMMRPQFELGPSNGVAFSTRADFYITLTSISENGHSVDINPSDISKDIAIFADGYIFHASQENQRFFNDLKKRAAIVNSGNKISWTLTWTDIEKFDANDDLQSKDSIAFAPEHDKSFKAVKGIKQLEASASDFLHQKNSMERLIWILENPETVTSKAQKIAWTLLNLQKEFLKITVDEADLGNYYSRNGTFPANAARATNLQNGDFYVFPDIQMNVQNFFKFVTAIRIKDLELKSSLFITENIQALDKTIWERFWQIYNLTQIFTSLEEEEEELTIFEAQDKYSCLIYHDESVHGIVKELIDHNIAFEQEGGFFLKQGKLFAEAMLGSHDNKIFINPMSEADEKVFLDAGYTKVDPNNFDINLLK
jgi:DEAD/DEAH box helicase domain-containing protein